MVGEIESLGEAITGGVIGRAVEPNAGEKDGHTHEANCLNCRAPLTGAYCARCGQKAHLHRTISAFLHDLLHGVLHFDGKTWRTLPLLAWHPGKLTRNYIDGQRARFVSPLALFLFSVFVMFALLNLTVKTDGLAGPQISGDLQQSIVETEQKIAKLESRRLQPLKPGETRAELDARILKQRTDLEDLRALRDIANHRKTKFKLSSDLGWLQEPLERAAANPELLIYKIRTSAYKWSWALIPISAPFLWLLFPFSRRFRMYDHVIFVTYSLAFMNLLVVAGTLLYLAGLPAIGGFLLFVPPIHFYRQLKESYDLSRFGALWRTVALTLLATIGLVLFGLLMLAVGVL